MYKKISNIQIMEATRIVPVDLLRPMKVGDRIEIDKTAIESHQMAKSTTYLKQKGEGVWQVQTKGRKNELTYFVERKA